MARRDIQLALVQDLLAAPGSEEGWSTFLLNLCDALHGSAASFISHDYGTASGGGVAVTSRTDPEALVAYQEHWHRQDPWATSLRAPRLHPGTVVPGEALISQADMHKTAFYNDFGRRYGIVQCLAGVIETTAERLSCLSINGTTRRPAFDEADAALLDSLMPSVQRALAIHRRLGGAELMAVHAAAVLDRLPHGVLLVAANGAVLSTNRAADEILRARDGLTYDGRELRGATADLTTRLHAALAGAGAVLLPRPSGRRPLSVVVAPLPACRAALASDGAAVAVFVTDPERATVPDADTIGRLLGLTRAEARLVQCLVGGRSLEECAANLDLRLETVRSRLKVIFQKTETHRQADLVRLVLAASAPNLRL